MPDYPMTDPTGSGPGYNASNQQTWGADRTVQVVAGAANQTTITLAACGTSGSGC